MVLRMIFLNNLFKETVSYAKKEKKIVDFNHKKCLKFKMYEKDYFEVHNFVS